jgi:hypothetical protein
MKNVTSQTYTNNPINNTGGAGTAYINTWSTPTRLEVNELNDSIEMIYEETSLGTLTIYSYPPPQKRYFKIVFSCVDGKWNKSEKIYGKKIEHQEYFEF